MYRYGDGQISLTDFQQPMGMKLREDNRWVKKPRSSLGGRLRGAMQLCFPLKPEMWRSLFALLWVP